jgi:hypothetical protein
MSEQMMNKEMCPEEIKHGGCKYRWEPDHKSVYFHFTHFDPVYADTKSICRYKSCECWAINSEVHNSVFVHDIVPDITLESIPEIDSD